MPGCHLNRPATCIINRLLIDGSVPSEEDLRGLDDGNQKHVSIGGSPNNMPKNPGTWVYRMEHFSNNGAGALRKAKATAASKPMAAKSGKAAATSNSTATKPWPKMDTRFHSHPAQLLPIMSTADRRATAEVIAALPLRGPTDGPAVDLTCGWQLHFATQPLVTPVSQMGACGVAALRFLAGTPNIFVPELLDLRLRLTGMSADAICKALRPGWRLQRRCDLHSRFADLLAQRAGGFLFGGHMCHADDGAPVLS